MRNLRSARQRARRRGLLHGGPTWQATFRRRRARGHVPTLTRSRHAAGTPASARWTRSSPACSSAASGGWRDCAMMAAPGQSPKHLGLAAWKAMTPPRALRAGRCGTRCDPGPIATGSAPQPHRNPPSLGQFPVVDRLCLLASSEHGGEAGDGCGAACRGPGGPRGKAHRDDSVRVRRGYDRKASRRIDSNVEGLSANRNGACLRNIGRRQAGGRGDSQDDESKKMAKAHERSPILHEGYGTAPCADHECRRGAQSAAIGDRSRARSSDPLRRSG